ncbi:MAG: hypothetical protein K0V04_14800 [Deltaproteobacteria bacterium]|nr:hypothetical protein [Deltaproteobacteria bacterium]
MMRQMVVVVGWTLLSAGCGTDEPSAEATGSSTAGDSTNMSTSASTGTMPDSTTGTPPPPVTSGGLDSSGDTEASTSGPAGCALGTPAPEAMFEQVLRHDGLDRELLVYVPPGYDHRAPMPVVLAFHGYTNTPAQQEDWSMLSQTAADEGFVLVYPRGTGALPGWNAGDCCLGTGSRVDDVGFTAAILDWLESELCIDTQRVFATGFSNGGFLSHRLACELSDRIAAIAPVAGVMGIDDCAPARPMPVLHMHGTSDFVVPYIGSIGLGFESVADTIAGWVDRNGCQGDPVSSYARGDASCERYERCDAGVEVELCTIEGGGHTWPGGANIPGAGVTSQDLSANERMWAFFMAHPLP